MSDEKNFNEENEENEVVENNETEVTEVTEETETAEAVEAVTDAAADAANDIVEGESIQSVLGDNADDVDNTDDGAEISAAVAEAQTAFQEIEGQKKNGKGGIIAIVVVAVLVVALAVGAFFMFGPSLFNEYNRQGYVDVSGRTIADIAEESGMEVADFLEQYDLPEDMPANTTESAAYNNIPLSKMAVMYTMDFETMKEALQLPADVTEDTPWGEAIAQTTLGAYVGEDNLAEFKEYYGLGDDVTADTLWGQIRNTVDEKSRQERIESEKAAEESAKTSEDASTADTAADTEAVEPTDVAETTEAPAAE